MIIWVERIDNQFFFAPKGDNWFLIRQKLKGKWTRIILHARGEVTYICSEIDWG